MGMIHATGHFEAKKNAQNDLILLLKNCYT